MGTRLESSSSVTGRYVNRVARSTQFLLSISIVLILGSTSSPTIAITSGPQQPEFSGFSALGTDGYVNHFTGDLNYDIPLFTLPGPNGGYDFQLGYNSNVTMEQEASWVGLGWSLNVGVINRDMRGLPDEFNGDLNNDPSDPDDGDVLKIKKDREGSYSWGLGVGVGAELVGLDSVLR